MMADAKNTEVAAKKKVYGWIGWAWAGAALIYLSLPPCDLWPLAWIAPVPWVLLIRRKTWDERRPYLKLWLVGFVFWLGAIHWLRLPHPLTHFGWLALSFYFAFYVPTFIGLGRLAVHRFHVPAILAAPIIWTGLELARGHLLTGMTMGSLAHTQYRWIELIQVSDLVGAYGVSFVVMFVAACIARALPSEEQGRAFWPIAPAAIVLALVLGYGRFRAAETDRTRPADARIALIQGSIDTEFNHDDPAKMRRRIFEEFFPLSQEAVKKFGKLDLIVWPETFFIEPLLTIDNDAGDRDPQREKIGLSAEEWRRRLGEWKSDADRAFKDVAEGLGTRMLLGSDAVRYMAEGTEVRNAAIYVSSSGEILGEYDKMHLVMFGEYIPFADKLKWLYSLTPLSMGITAGEKPAAFQLGSVRFAPNICYESVLPQIIRGQILALKADGREPDLLINVTNDGWFWGSSELDMHLACAVFRAVEFRKPFLIAANTGFSASIDGDGRILVKGPRRAREALLAEVRKDGRGSLYLLYGDWFAGACLAFCLGVGAAGWFGGKVGRRA